MALLSLVKVYISCIWFQTMLGLAQKEDSLANRRLVLHCTILQANQVGAPASQTLVRPGTSSEAQPAEKGAASVGKKRVSVFTFRTCATHVCYGCPLC